ncbi:hypothetical protein GFS60_06920 (plasmid) [Rhodococcus sp. WAY2]|nr:hypothetical protein GFS60_06920 [Rhodococcus sp. WAY2]
MVTAAEKSRSRRINSRERAEVAKLRAENERLKEKVGLPPPWLALGPEVVNLSETG